MVGTDIMRCPTCYAFTTTSDRSMCSAQADVRLVPIADINGLFDDLIDAGE